MAEYIVCGWYTPDYGHWWNVLRPTLEYHGAPHDFTEVNKRAGGWEVNTMAKPHQLLAAMDRHPDKVIVFIDVDCVVRAPLAPLADIRADVAFYIRTKRKKTHAKWGSIRSGTLIIRPTPHARKFVEAWIAKGGAFAEVDQNTLMLAMCDVPSCTFEALPVAYCAIPADKVASPIILHDSASAGIAKVGKLAKRLYRAGAPQWLINAMPAKRTSIN